MKGCSKLWARNFRMICLACLLGVMAVPLVSASPAVGVGEFQLGADQLSAEVGEEISVTIQGSGLSDLYAAEIQVSFDNTRLAWVEGADGMEDVYSVTPELSGGTLRLAYTLVGSVPGLTGNHALYTLQFHAIKSGSAAVALAHVKTVDSDLQEGFGELGGALAVAIAEPNDDGGTDDDGDNGNGDGAGSGDGAPPAGGGTKGGIPNVQVDAADFQQALANAGSGKKVSIQLDAATGAEGFQLQVPGELVQLAKESNIHTIRFAIGDFMFEFDPKLVESGTAGYVEISVAHVERSDWPEKAKRQLGDHAVLYDFDLKIDGVPRSEFRGSELRVAVPYTLQPGEKPGKIVAYYVADDGELAVVKNGKYNAVTGQLEFKPKHFSTYAVGAAEASFNDLARVGWAQDAIEGLAARSIVSGVGGGKFDPDGPVTRAAFLTMLMQAFDLVDPAAQAEFTDVQPGVWYAAAVASAQQAGIVSGRNDGSFGANDPISRQDMTVLMYRMAKHLQADLADREGAVMFADRERIASYAADAVAALQRAGIVYGMDGNKFEPSASSTRAQAAALLYRLYLVVE